MYSCPRCGEDIHWFAGTYATVMNPHRCASCGTALHAPWTRWWAVLVLALPIGLYFPAEALAARGITGGRSAFAVVFAAVAGLWIGLQAMAWQVGELHATTPAQVRFHRTLFVAVTVVWLAIPLVWLGLRR